MLGIAVLALVMRLVALGADPSFDTEGGFYGDWGEWLKNARLHALWGVWRVDDYNRGLMISPAFTMAVRLAFLVGGVGRVQALVINGLAGTVTCLVLWAFARRFTGARVAMLALLLMVFNPLAIAHDRSAYPESFQLVFLVCAIAPIMLRSSKPWLMAVGGTSLVLAVLAKASGVAFLPIIAAVWMARVWLDHRDGLATAAWRRDLGWYAGAALVSGGAAYALFFLPHQAEILRLFTTMSVGQLDPVAAGNRPDRISPFFWPAVGFRQNRFFTLEWYLVVMVACLAVGRLTGAVRLAVTRLEVAGWIWFSAGLGYLARLFYQPDRRFLMIVPPAVLLSAILLGGDLDISQDSQVEVAWKSLRFAGAGALMAALPAFYLAPRLTPRMMSLMGSSSWFLAASAFVSFAIVVGALAGLVLRDAAPVHLLLRRQWLIAVAIALVVAARWGRDYLHRTYTMNDVSSTIDSLTHDWPANERVMNGAAAATFAFGTRMIGVNVELAGAPVQERFHPPLAVYTFPPPQSIPGRWLESTAVRPAMAECLRMPFWYDRAGHLKYIVHLVVPRDRLDACRAHVPRNSVRAARSRSSEVVLAGALLAFVLLAVVVPSEVSTRNFRLPQATETGGGGHFYAQSD